MAIESDEKGADSRLAVQFYSKPIQNEFETQKQGRPIFLDCDFVKIFVPGDNLSIVDQPVREDHMKRFPIQWAHYQNKHGGDSREIGTPLSQWPLLTLAQVEELKAMKFFTVDAIAGASDAQIQRLQMIGGMSPYAFRDRAIRFLALAKDEATNNADAEKIAKLEAENAANKASLELMQAQMLQLMTNTQNSDTVKKKGGRPRKDVAEDNMVI